jgi:2-hydroxychromene-2-carboxylate isomerase
LANRVLIAALRQRINIDNVAHAMLKAHWAQDVDLSDPSALRAIGLIVGLDFDPLLEAALSTQVQHHYQANTEEAIRRSVLGSPTYFVDGDMFYGQDRLEMVERALKIPFSRAWNSQRTS